MSMNVVARSTVRCADPSRLMRTSFRRFCHMRRPLEPVEARRPEHHRDEDERARDAAPRPQAR